MIYAVANEGRSDVFSTFKRLNILFDIREMPHDYAVGNYEDDKLLGVPVERKDAADFISSKPDGRLDRQLYDLSTNSPISYVCIVGDLYGASIQAGSNWNSILSSLAGSSYRRSPDGCQGVVQIVQFPLTSDFCMFMKYLDEKIQRNEPRLPIFPKKVQQKPEEILVRILQGFPKVGPKTAQNLIQHFNTIHDFANSTSEQLLSVEGIGTKTALELYSYLNMRYGGKND